MKQKSTCRNIEFNKPNPNCGEAKSQFNSLYMDEYLNAYKDIYFTEFIGIVDRVTKHRVSISPTKNKRTKIPERLKKRLKLFNYI